ncbi:DUF2953 domain-containing protein [Clostridium grantii]|uniref:DUF2953 domain-containing protein n=1 Tax=Clostridium grantii DSM 8605 TaxID=1121316 RepID=A0A1M5SA58_9CLOT|nr:DUF2953 domain-containing protein [Clostridium grantii]SHH35477.1 Protein of unknown function [Clostridium grantii DSM 8605]
MRTLIIIFIVLFLPLPIVLGVFFNEDKEFFFKFYGFKVEFSSLMNKFKQKKNHKKTKKNKSKDKKSENNTLTNLKALYFSLTKSYIKPYLFVSLYNEYGVGDAALDGIIYGLIFAFNAIPLALIKSIMNLKILKFQINPAWNEEKFLIKLNIIFIFNLFIIIFLLLLFFYKSKKLKSLKKSLPT